MARFHVFPHCDMHLALNNPATSTLDFRVFQSKTQNDGTFVLDDVTGDCSFQMLAPHNPVGNRLESFVTIDPTARTITADSLGTNLVIIQRQSTYITVRIQVHDDILEWFFGNAKMTAVLDNQHAHSQPSIYGVFSDDGTGTDRVGDITGHGFVNLTSSDPTTFTVANADNEGRIIGLKENIAALDGSFLGQNESIDIEVVNYAQTRNILESVRVSDASNLTGKHNILFIPEGFTSSNEDRAKFDELVTMAATELFSKPRHEPFGTLSDVINVFKAYVPSAQPLITCGFQVTDKTVDALGKGRPIPYEDNVSDDDNAYEIAELVERVGLPMRGESRSAEDLTNLWNSQSLHDFDDSKVDDDTIEAWKNSQSDGFLETRNSFFGMKIGARWADNRSTAGEAAIPTPPNDDGSDALKAFVKRAYEFYKLRKVSRSISMDPRRYAPQVYRRSNESRTSWFMDFLSGLQFNGNPVGTQWVPDGSTFKRSRGLIAMIINEHMDGGTNINDHTFTANNIQNDRSLTADYLGPAGTDIGLMRREVPDDDDMEADLSSTINTIAHEFGHSFNLGDEYEEFPRDNATRSDQADNIASLSSIFDDPNFATSGSRDIDPDKLKWRVLPRIKQSSTITDIQFVGGKLEVIISARETTTWEPVRAAASEVHIRRIKIEMDGKQLPLSTSDADHLLGLHIDSIDVSTGKIILSSDTPLSLPAGFPNNPTPDQFTVGWSLFLPHRNDANNVITVIEDKVFANLVATKDPLNKDTDTTKVNKKPDFPRDIDDFKPPCQSARLVGVFEGAGRYTGLVYRPTGTCKMRTSGGEDENGAFCHVCKWLITNRVDPGKHHEVDRKFYPEAKKNE